jgi:flagellum-specific peptidoglycan hydrolase FlgJ
MKKLHCILFFFILSSSLLAQKITIEAYIDMYKDIAMKEMLRSGVPASITLAQGILETDYGNSPLVKKSNNHFGIKCKETWKGPSVSHDDDAPQECFRKYENPIESYIDHSDFLRTRKHYHFLFDLDPLDYKAWAYGLKKAGYATNPKYPMILIKYIETYNLNNYSLMAMGKKPNVNNDIAKTEPKRELSKVKASPDKVRIEENQEVQVVAVKPVSSSTVPKQTIPVEKPKEEIIKSKTIVSYPEGEFKINQTKVVYAQAGTSLLSLASNFNIPLKYLYDFNDFANEQELLDQPQLIYLQRKRRVGAVDFHVVSSDETLYDIAQKQGIRLEALLQLNHLTAKQKPAVGEKLYLQQQAPNVPLLAVADNIPQQVMSAANQQDEAEYEVHIVQSKETLYAISRKYNISVQQLLQWNDLSGNDLKEGMELIISQKDYETFKSTR